MKSSFLFVFDFDNTLIDDDSDHYVVKQLSPPLFEKLNSLTKTVQWTDLMNQMVGELFDMGFSSRNILDSLDTIPIHPDMKAVLTRIHEKGSSVILSDANTLYIDHITKFYGIDSLISKVITNPAVVNNQDKIIITRYTILPHGCPNGCAVNICKGKELLPMLVPNSRVVYLGDGRNDFCPMTKLSENDWALVRKGKALDKLVQDPVYRIKIKAQVLVWETATDILQFLDKFFN